MTTKYFNVKQGITTGNILLDGITGNITANNANLGNALTANFFIGSGNNLSNLAGANVTGNVANANFAGFVTGNAQGNITSVGTLTSLDVTGNISGGNLTTTGAANVGTLAVTGTSNLGAVGNVTITGGTNGYFLQTNGSGTLTWAAQTAGSAIANGTSNVSIPAVNGNVNLTAGGNTSLVVTATGANIAGNLDVTGNLTAGNITTAGSAGNITGANNISANTFTSIITTGTAPFVVTSTTQVANLNVATSGTAVAVTGNAQGNITSVGSLTGLTVSNATGVVDFTTTANVTLGNVSNLHISGGSANYVLHTDGVGNLTWSAISAGSIIANGNSNVNIPTTNGNVNITAVGNTTMVIAGTGANIAGTLDVTGNANTGNLGTGFIFASGNITTTTLTSNIATGTAPFVVTSTTQVANLNVATAGLAGAVTGNAQGNITSVGSLTSLTVTGNANVGNLGTTNLIATGTGSFSGNVSMNSYNIVSLATPINATDAATKQYVDDVAQGLNIHDACAAATPATLATITTGTITYNNGASGVGANLVTTGSFNLIDGVNVQTSGTRILVKNEANAAHNGIYTWSNATVITRATDFNSVPEVEAGDFTFVTGGSLYDNTGWVQTDVVVTIGTDPISWTQFSGAGSYTAGTGLTLTGSQFSISNTSVTSGSYGSGDAVATFTVNPQGQLTAASNTAITANAANLTGTTLNASIITSSLTTVGTLGNLTVTGNISAGNISAGAGSGGNITGANLVSANYFTGTLTTAAQPNITSVGTLTSLNVTGLSNLGNVGNVIITGGTNGYYLQTNGSGNLVWAAISAGSAITNGTSNVSIPTVNGNVNITSAGNTTLVVTGTGANITGTLNANGDISGSQITSTITTGTAPFVVTSTTQVANLNVATAGLAVAVTGNAQGNITSVGSLTGLTVSNATGIVDFTTTANVTLGAVANLHISGGTSGQVLSTNGSGGLSFVSVSSSSISNGTSNVNIPAVNGNVDITSAGNTTMVITGTGANIAGTLNVTGNLTAGNITTSGSGGNISNVNNISANTFTSIIATGTAPFVVTSTTQVANLNVATAGLAVAVTGNAQGNITSVGTLTSLDVTGNISGGNISANTFTSTIATGTAPFVVTSTTQVANLNVATAGTAGLAVAVTGNAQGNITSVGTLTSLDVTGNISGGNISTVGTANVGTLIVTGATNFGNLTANYVSLTGGLTSNRSNVTVATNTVIDQFAPTTFRTAKYIISASGDDGFQSVETLLIHDGTTSYITIYGSICSNNVADIIELSSNINGVSGNVAVYATGSSANLKVNLVSTYIKT